MCQSWIIFCYHLFKELIGAFRILGKMKEKIQKCLEISMSRFCSGITHKFDQRIFMEKIRLTDSSSKEKTKKNKKNKKMLEMG